MSSLVESKNMSTSNTSDKLTKEDCFVCAESVYSRKMVQCPFCDFSACVTCVDRFLMGIDDDRPRCMSPACKKVWSYEFLASKFPPSFHNKKYRNRRAELLLEREMSLMPGTQNLVAQERRRIETETKIRDLMDENAMYRELIRLNDIKIREFRYVADEKKNDEKNDDEKNDTKFTRACPVEDCRGFLSTSLKCGTCNGYACKDCHMPLAYLLQYRRLS